MPYTLKYDDTVAPSYRLDPALLRRMLTELIEALSDEGAPPDMVRELRILRNKAGGIPREWRVAIGASLLWAKAANVEGILAMEGCSVLVGAWMGFIDHMVAHPNGCTDCQHTWPGLARWLPPGYPS